MKVSMLPNPSHLGTHLTSCYLLLRKLTSRSSQRQSTRSSWARRAKQFALIEEADPECSLVDKVMSLQLHGDVSLTGQGIVMESLGLSTCLAAFRRVVD